LVSVIRRYLPELDPESIDKEKTEKHKSKSQKRVVVGCIGCFVFIFIIIPAIATVFSLSGKALFGSIKNPPPGFSVTYRGYKNLANNVSTRLKTFHDQFEKNTLSSFELTFDQNELSSFLTQTLLNTRLHKINWLSWNNLLVREIELANVQNSSETEQE